MADPQTQTPKRTDVDDEVRAMSMVTAALRDLDRAAATRVIKWAEQRWIKLDTPSIDVDFFSKFTEALAEAAKQVGGVTGLDIINALSAAEREREARLVAEAGSDA